MADVIVEMTSKKLGCSAIINDEGLLVGMITDGDLRRQLQTKGNSLLSFTAGQCMTASPRSISAEELAVSALSLMEDRKITMLPVINTEGNPVGMLHMHDLIRAGIL